jgi:predicted ATPase
MDIDITIKNYRCFPISKPARICLRPGFTALVGVNNAGKSSLLRFLFDFRSLFSMVAPANGGFLWALKGVQTPFAFPPHILDVNEIFNDSNKEGLEIEIRAQPTSPLGPLVPAWLRLVLPRASNTFVATIDLHNHPFDPQSLRFMNGNGRVLETQAPQGLGVGTRRVDISGLQEAAQVLARTFYIGSFRNAINAGAKEDYFDVKVGQAFIQTWRQLKTGGSKAANEAAYKLTQDIAKIFELRDLEINPSPDDSTLQIFVNGKSYRLSALGSGLAQFILVLASAAAGEPSYILIDEPELNLHASLQLDFLTTLASYATDGILFASHNIGLARAAADRIYAVRRIRDGESELVPFEGLVSLPEFLGELSYSGYSDIPSSRILLVEGVNEVKPIQQFLRLRRLDHRVVLLHLGGAAMINGERDAELAEIKRISANVTALVDSERDRPHGELDAQRAAFAEVCKRLSIPCHILERRATENYLVDRAIKKVKGDKYRALGAYERLQDANPSWAKAENWRIAREMTPEELEGTDLGSFLDDLGA